MDSCTHCVCHMDHSSPPAYSLSRSETRLKQKERSLIQKKNRDLMKKWETDFIQASVHIIHSNLRLAVFFSDQRIACLEKDEEFFEEYEEFLKKHKNSIDTTIPKTEIYTQDSMDAATPNSKAYSQIYCENNISKMKRKIQAKYPLMRAYLAITQLRTFKEPTEYQLNTQTQNKSVKNKLSNPYEVEHLLPGLAEDLPLISKKEIREAKEIWRRDQAARRAWRETGELPPDLRNQTCTKISDFSLLSCYRDKYRELLIGNEDQKKPGLPILGFIRSVNPTDQELADGIRQIRANTAELLKSFREDYFITRLDGSYKFNKHRDYSLEENLDLFGFLPGRLENTYDGYEKFRKKISSELSVGSESPEVSKTLQTLITFGSQEYQSKVNNMLYLEVFAIGLWGVTCLRFFKNPLAQSSCLLPVGFGWNLISFFVDTRAYKNAVKVALYRPDDKHSVQYPLSEMNDLEFTRNVTTILLPFFTGVPQLIKIL